MEISAKELRGKPGEIIEQASRGTDVVITIRGKKMARLVPYETDKTNQNQKEIKDEIFGLWANRGKETTVEEYVREKRKRRAI
jgi:prevent-host-death family protein